MTNRLFCAMAALLGFAPVAPSQVPIRALGRITAVSPVTFASIASVRPLPGRRVIVNDQVGRRLVMLDSTLTNAVVIADTTGATAKAYGSRAGGLIAFTGDSSLFADATALALLVIDGGGKIVRTIAAPLGPVSHGPRGLDYLVYYDAASDGLGNICLKWYEPLVLLPPPPPLAEPVVRRRDSLAMILRINLQSKIMDTVARLASPVSWVEGGASPSVLLQRPISAEDGWALLPDGTIAIVRVGDYHIDWVSPAGIRTASPKIQHQWERITDSMKTALVDSARAADSIRRAALARTDSFVNARGGRGRGGEPPSPEAVRAALLAPVQRVVGTEELPDYRPPFVTTFDTTRAWVTRADADGNIWIRVNQTKPLPGGPVFDVVNRSGALIDRIQIPGGTTIIAFDRGAVYLVSREGDGYHLARAGIR